ncbi:MAG: tRNA pseudouridine synthase A [Bacteroidales bacterium]|nr:tRNA pseudouridine synthase A [Bacteroidales bacterium]
MRFFLLLSYNGSAFNGWQRQINGPSVQEHLEFAFSAYLREKIEITGAGRTDTGVHAINYVAHLDSCNDSLTKEQQLLLYKINAILPSGIVVNDICQVSDSCHARFDAVSRTYKYFVHTKKEPFLNEYSCFFPYELDIDAMNLAAAMLLGERDFTSMAKLHTDVKHHICTVTRAEWQPLSPLNISGPDRHNSPGVFEHNSPGVFEHNSPGVFEHHSPGVFEHNSPGVFEHPNTFCFTISANRFLRNMVRAIVGSLLEIGRGRERPEWILEVLDKKDRGAAGSSVSSHALFLSSIEYPYKIF